MGLIREQIGVQVHCLRREMSSDFPGTLQRLSAMGIETVELCSFAGCSGNPWGDFGKLADWPPEKVRDALRESDLRCVSTHVTYEELSAEHIESTMQWAEAVDAPVIVLSGLPGLSAVDPESARRLFIELNDLGTRLSGNGFDFAYHTQNDVWKGVGDGLLAHLMFDEVDPECCRIELDPSGALVHGTDWTSLVRENRGRFFAMHLRDGKRPEREVPYLPAVPLGSGDENWATALAAASDAEISTFLLEMELDRDGDVFGAIRESRDFLNSFLTSNPVLAERAG